MANSGFLINPSVIQVFTSGPNSGSVVSSSFNETFDSGSGFTSASLCNTEYVFRVEDFENCPVVDECPVPSLQAAYVIDCGSSSRNYGISIPSSTVATTLVVEYSTFENFSQNTGSFSTPASTFALFTINVDDLELLPLSKETPIYFRAYYDCGGGNIGAYSVTNSASCPPPENPARIVLSPVSVPINICYNCVNVSVILPPKDPNNPNSDNSRTVKITKSGNGFYTTQNCIGINTINIDTTETITQNKTYTLGINAEQGNNNFLITRITVQVLKGNVVEDTYILTRNHTNNFC